MKLLDDTDTESLRTADHLATDERLLQRCDVAESPQEVLRFWENRSHAVIVGRSSKLANEVNLSYCQEHRIEFLRRDSGGAAVVIGPGCLMYSLILDYRLRPELKMLDRAHSEVMGRLVSAVRSLGIDAEVQGTCDLTIGGQKFSGNAVRCQRNSMLYHGTLLYKFALPLIEACLGMPPRQPEYRAGRRHVQFVTNLPADPSPLKSAIAEEWTVQGRAKPIDRAEVERLVEEKYTTHDWIWKR